MKALARTFVVSLILSAIAFAQTNRNNQKSKPPEPDLSGVWLLDESKSSVGSGDSRLSDYVLTITQRGPEIRMNKKYRRGGREQSDEVIYYTDGRPELQRGRLDSEPVIRWRDGKLERKSRSGPGVPTNPPLEIVTTEEWELSIDGKTLTRTNIMTGAIVRKSRFVFNRSP